jgi:pimeloyl-ACP methyl ester carboxylesterase
MKLSNKGLMRPWPTLEAYGRTIPLPKSEIELFTYDTGPAGGQTILLVHGLGDEADTWRHLLPELSAGNRVLAPDLPGFGRSSRPERPLSAPFLVSVLLELLDALNVPSALLVGSSLGGLLCQEIVLTRPERATGLVLLDGMLVATGAALNLQLLLFLIPGVGEWLYKRLRRDPQEAYDTLRPYYADLDSLPQADRDFLFQRVNERVWSDKQRRAYFSVLRQLALWSPRQQRSLPERLGVSQVPTLVIWGEEDWIVSVAAAEKLVKLQPSARLVTIAGAGHLPHQEKPAAVLEVMWEDGRVLDGQG